jgi:hypothetical protein
LFAGMAGHSILPLETLITASYGLVTAMLGHAVGWPMARGGSQKIAEKLAHLRALGAAARRASSRRLRPTCARWEARSRPAAWCSRWTSCLRRAPSCWISPHASS